MTKEEADKIYHKLKEEGLTDEEIAESFVFSIDTTEEEDELFRRELNKRRKEYLREQRKQKLDKLDGKESV